MNISIPTICPGFSRDILISSGFILSLKDDELKSKNRLPHSYICKIFHETKFTDHWKFERTQVPILCWENIVAWLYVINPTSFQSSRPVFPLTISHFTRTFPTRLKLRISFLPNLVLCPVLFVSWLVTNYPNNVSYCPHPFKSIINSIHLIFEMPPIIHYLLSVSSFPLLVHHFSLDPSYCYPILFTHFSNQISTPSSEFSF